MITHRYKGHFRAKKKKSIFRSRFFWLSLLILVILVVGFYFLVFHSFFQVKEIEISGNRKIAAGELKDTIFSQINKKIFFLNTKSIFLADLKELNKMLIKKFPQVVQMEITRKLPNILIVKIEERVPVAIFVQGEDYFFIDKEGIIFEKIWEINPQTLKIKKSTLVEDLELGKMTVENGRLSQILKINSIVNDDFKISLVEVLIMSEKRLNAKTSEGWQIYFNPEKDINWQLTELGILLKEKIPFEKRKNLDYIDLRFTKVYYKYR